MGLGAALEAAKNRGMSFDAAGGEPVQPADFTIEDGKLVMRLDLDSLPARLEDMKKIGNGPNDKGNTLIARGMHRIPIIETTGETVQDAPVTRVTGHVTCNFTAIAVPEKTRKA